MSLFNYLTNSIYIITKYIQKYVYCSFFYSYNKKQCEHINEYEYDYQNDYQNDYPYKIIKFKNKDYKLNFYCYICSENCASNIIFMANDKMFCSYICRNHYFKNKSNFY